MTVFKFEYVLVKLVLLGLSIFAMYK